MGLSPTDYFYSHVNYSVTKIHLDILFSVYSFYSHVNYSVTKIIFMFFRYENTFTVT